MWLYEKKLEYPVKIKNSNPALARVIISQLGGPDGEVGAATRYLQQRYSMPYGQVKGMLTDIGSEGSNLHLSFSGRVNRLCERVFDTSNAATQPVADVRVMVKLHI